MILFPARAVHTMDRGRPRADAVLVDEGRVVAVGTVDELRAHGEATLDDRFADKVLLPGFVEAHSHSFEGGQWAHTYCGWFDRADPEGRVWSGCHSIDEVVARLSEVETAMSDPGAPLFAWGLDPIYFPGDRLEARHLDAVSEHRRIFVMHASGHLATVNSAVIDDAGLADGPADEAVPRGADGRPTGELLEPAGMARAGDLFPSYYRAMKSEGGLRAFGRLARNAGITTLTDLGSTNLANPKVRERWRAITDDPSFPARVSIFHNPAFGGGLDEQVAMVVGLREESTEKLRFGHVKFILDGSIQGFTARLRPPRYLPAPDGSDRGNGLWLVPPDEVADRLAAFHGAGLLVHAHCNGDEAVDVYLDAIERVLTDAPRPDHRHTVQHCQLTTADQYRRMAALGACANVFANHTWYWGDQHHDVTVGPDRSQRMNAAATALAAGVPLSMHCDAGVTPLGSLHVAWCAVNRRTPSGRVLGADERISVHEALTAITVGAAYQLKMDHEIGSIRPGLRADFAVLDDDPYEVDPMALRDIGVWGTVLGGVPQPADGRS